MSDPAATAKRIEYVPLDHVEPAKRNPKKHKIAELRASISRFGFVTPGVRDERTGLTLAGHGRIEALKAMRADGEQPPAGIHTDKAGGWLVPVICGWASRSDAEAEAYIVADNQHTIAGGWDEPELALLVQDLNAVDPTMLGVIGFDDNQLAAILNNEPLEVPDPFGGTDRGEGSGDGGSDEPGEDEAPSQEGKGDLLGLAGATIGDPEFEVARGEIWHMGERLVLAVANPHTEWQLWAPLLKGDALLLPYPSPMAAIAEGAQGRDVVFVQPNKHLAGWLLTKWARVTGGKPRRVEPA